MDGLYQNEKRQNTSTDTSAGLNSLVLFNQNSHFAYIHKKTEKLVTAVYMITNFIKDNEPLKWKIREKALSLMALNISFNTVSLSERRDLIKEYQALSLEIISLSSIAYHSGLISEMNHSILAREFMGLVETIEKDENKKANEETVILHPGFFDVPKTEPRDIIKDTHTTKTQHGLTGAVNAVINKGHSTHFIGASSDEIVSDRKQEYLPIKDAVTRPSRTAESKDNRQEIIIKLLSKKSGLNIKDFAVSIKGVSAKTIQRELLAMVASGVLKKEGERRWSTYSLSDKSL